MDNMTWDNTILLIYIPPKKHPHYHLHVKQRSIAATERLRDRLRQRESSNKTERTGCDKRGGKNVVAWTLGYWGLGTEQQKG